VTAFFASLAVLLVSGAAFHVAAGGLGEMWIPLLIAHVLTSGALLLGLLMATRLTRKHYSAARFGRLAAAFTVAACLALSILVAEATVIPWAVSGGHWEYLLMALGPVSLMSEVVGVLLAALLAGYLLLAFNVPVFRMRFRTVLRRPADSEDADPSTGNEGTDPVGGPDHEPGPPGDPLPRD
jgi:hypothetical protein